LGIGGLLASESGGGTGEKFYLSGFVGGIHQRHLGFDILILKVGAKKKELPEANGGELTRKSFGLVVVIIVIDWVSGAVPVDFAHVDLFRVEAGQDK
jgi:hypothetical protein